MGILYQLPVGSEPNQTMTFTVGSTHVRLTLYYNPVPTGGQWHMDVEDADTEAVYARGYALVVGVPLLYRTQLPFWFWLEDTSGLNLNPYGGNDLGARCLLYVMDRSDE
ncbi:hypothetical protein [Rahnella sp. ChDrAdgB13]|uniref:phage baseplate plug family protein n=1 Tax=Rahnella sp. ChDrAdgB13 TaxID=1850581 RepID=UPI001AD8719E|nr:hypothetical protein [Rahnella sp. ChDrAdgB13]